MSPIAPLWALICLQGAISAASLVVEIVAGRIIAPYVGMSLYTWTAIIAVVLAGFSVGHWWGGRLAERAAPAALRATAWAMVGAAAATGGSVLLLRWLSGPILVATQDPLVAITLLATSTFFLPSFFAGVPAPVLAAIAFRSSERSGHALGAMFAAGAVGAIAGTLLAGFLFISWLGSALTLAAVTTTYAIAALLLFRMAGNAARSLVLPALAAAAALGLAAASAALPRVCDHESQYFCIRTVDLSAEPGRPVRLMVIDHLAHGISARDRPEVMFTEHTAMLDAIARMRMGDREFSAFFIGGGSYSVPRAWAARRTGEITVAEIDPAVTEIAVRDFWYEPTTATILHEDARRALLVRPDTRYDVIVGDAFTDIAVPSHLVTREFFELVRARLTEDGVFLMNVIDFTDRLDALSSLVATLGSVFPAVEVWTEQRPPDPSERRVFVLVAGAFSSSASRLVAAAPEPTAFAALAESFVDGLVARKDPVVLTDDYAPIDRLVGLGSLTD